MTMTDSPPATASAAAAPSPAVAGLYDLLTTTDHKRIGRIWLGAGVLLLVAAVVLGVLLGLERLDADSVDIFGGDNAYFQMWALYRIGLALLVAVPLFIGLATIVVPMQVGSTNIAFPRAALAAAWGFLIGAAILIAAVFASGGWGAVDRATPPDREAVALTLVGMGLVIASILLASICVATTIVSLRVKGMTLSRTPLFAWSMLVASAVWLLTLPILMANLIVAYFDVHNGPGVFGGDLDGDLSIFSQVAWIVEQPQVYAFAIPALGILGSIAAVSAGVRNAQHSLMMGLIGAFGLLAIGGWSQPFFQSDLTATVAYDEKFVFIAFGIAAVLPVLGFIGATADTLVRGRSNIVGLPPGHLMLALGGGILLLAGTAAGVARVVEPLELGGRITVSGVMNLVLFGAIASSIAGIFFWSTKIGGHNLSMMLGRLVALNLVGGALLLGSAQVVNGFFETSNNPLEPLTEDAADVLNVVSLVGVAIIALGGLGLLSALARAMRLGTTGDPDPWGGHSLEWTTATPPPPGNFAEAPALVTSEAPILDLAESSDEGEDS
jgi:heme/copper-type cytochrome/quinol oxidase subunit 1